MKLVWSARAKTTFFSVLNYLNDNWTKKEIIQFNNKTEAVLQAIKKHPKMFPESNQHNNVRRAIIDKHNSLFYIADEAKQKIYLLTFFDNRQNPNKLKLS